MIFKRSEKGDSKSNSQSSKRFGMKSISTLAITAFAVMLLWTGGISASARTKLPTGDMDYIPKVNFCGEIERDESSVGKYAPIIKNVDLDTGEHYKYLAADEKILYEAIYKAVIGGQYLHYSDRAQIGNKSFIDPLLYKFYTGSASFISQYSGDGFGIALCRAAEAVYYDHPDHVELYMVYGANVYTSTNSNGTVDGYLLFVAKVDDSNFATYNTAIRNNANTIANTVKADNNGDSRIGWDAFKELKAHDYYCTSYGIDYDYGNLTKSGDAAYFDYCHTAYGSLVTKKAVCDGYSSGFRLIMKELGVNTMIITGDGGGASSLGGHAWNIIQLDGNWYEVDTTWDDNDGTVTGPESYITHVYFNETTARYAAGLEGGYHIRTSTTGYSGFRMPVARGTHWNYARVSGTDYSHDTNVAAAAILIDCPKEIYIGDTGTCTITVLPENATDKAYTLASLNPDILTISGNTITGVKEGVATIAALLNSDQSIYDTFDITVVSRPVTGITLPATMELEFGKTATLEPTIEPANATNKNYTLTSSDPAIVAAEGNIIKGVAAGTATITATTADGGFNAVCTVTVIISKNTEFTVAGNTYKITGKDTAALVGSTKTSISIPATFKKGGVKFKVTSVGDNAFAKNKKITSITGGKNLTSIGKNAFSECSKLKKFSISSTKVTKIGTKAFYKCGALATFNMNINKLSSIGGSALSKISAKAKITLAASTVKKYEKAVEKFKKAGAKKATYTKKK